MGDAAPVSRWAQRKQQREQMYATSSDAIQVSLRAGGKIIGMKAALYVLLTVVISSTKGVVRRALAASQVRMTKTMRFAAFAKRGDSGC